jgi:hypothetical protein
MIDMVLYPKEVTYDATMSRFTIKLDNGEELLMSALYLEEMISGTPFVSEEMHKRKLIEEIHAIQNKGVKEFGQLDKLAQDLDKGIEDAQDELRNTMGKAGVMKWKAVIDGYRSRKSILQERRHLLNAMHIEVGKLEAELARIQKGKESAKSDTR